MGHRTARTSLAHKLKSKRSARIGIVILILGCLRLSPRGNMNRAVPWWSG